MTKTTPQGSATKIRTGIRKDINNGMLLSTVSKKYGKPVSECEALYDIEVRRINSAVKSLAVKKAALPKWGDLKEIRNKTLAGGTPSQYAEKMNMVAR